LDNKVFDIIDARCNYEVNVKLIAYKNSLNKAWATVRLHHFGSRTNSSFK